ncbi:hypothetical protein AgCh_031297 [Apium graveolens]
MEQGHASSSTPSVSSSSVGMVSSKCVASVSKGSDLDCIIVTQEDNLVAKNGCQQALYPLVSIDVTNKIAVSVSQVMDLLCIIKASREMELSVVLYD